MNESKKPSGLPADFRRSAKPTSGADAFASAFPGIHSPLGAKAAESNPLPDFGKSAFGADPKPAPPPPRPSASGGSTPPPVQPPPPPPGEKEQPPVHTGGVEGETVAAPLFSEDHKTWKMWPWIAMRFGNIVFSSDEERFDDVITLCFGKAFVVIEGKRLAGAVADLSKNAVCRISPSRNRSGELGQLNWVRKVSFGEEEDEKKDEAEE